MTDRLLVSAGGRTQRGVPGAQPRFTLIHANSKDIPRRKFTEICTYVYYVSKVFYFFVIQAGLGTTHL